MAQRCISAVVYKSLSNNPFENLAFEDWVHERRSLEYDKILFLWRNEPTVVIGRHQNAWKECNLEVIRNCGVHLARRKSGGGAVYHDLGNVNCTFFSERSLYNRKANLQLIAQFLRSSYNFEVSLNERDDLVFDKHYKISGTAAKLSLKKAYHHFTLLCQADLPMLQASLDSNSSGISSNATTSVRSRTKNLFDDIPFSWDEFCSKLATTFLQKFGSKNDQKKFIELHPMNTDNCPEILELKNQLTDWNWTHGKTPKFNFDIEKQFSFSNIKLSMVINKGLIEDIVFDVSNLEFNDFILSYLGGFIGQRFCRTDILAVCTDSVSSNHNSEILCEISDWILSYLY